MNSLTPRQQAISKKGQKARCGICNHLLQWEATRNPTKALPVRVPRLVECESGDAISARAKNIRDRDIKYTRVRVDAPNPLPAGPIACQECNDFGFILLEVYEPTTGRVVAYGDRSCPKCNEGQLRKWEARIERSKP